MMPAIPASLAARLLRRMSMPAGAGLTLLLAACAQPAPTPGPQVVDPYASLGGGAVYQGGLPGGSLGSEATPEYFAGTVGDTVLFPGEQTALTTEARAILTRQAEWLKSNPGFQAVVQGHADEQGTREYNLALGARRAGSVQEYLIAQGVPPDRIRTLSFGKERPLATCSDEECYARNRRAVTVVTQTGAGA